MYVPRLVLFLDVVGPDENITSKPLSLCRVPTDQGNQGKTEVFQPNQGKKFKLGNFFHKPFSNLLNL